MAALVYKEGNLTRNPKVTNFFKIFNNFDYNNNNKLIFIKKSRLESGNSSYNVAKYRVK